MRPIHGVVVGIREVLLENGSTININQKYLIGTELVITYDFTKGKIGSIFCKEKIKTEEEEDRTTELPPSPPDGKDHDVVEAPIDPEDLIEDPEWKSEWESEFIDDLMGDDF